MPVQKTTNQTNSLVPDVSTTAFGFGKSRSRVSALTTERRINFMRAVAFDSRWPPASRCVISCSESQFHPHLRACRWIDHSFAVSRLRCVPFHPFARIKNGCVFRFRSVSCLTVCLCPRFVWSWIIKFQNQHAPTLMSDTFPPGWSCQRSLLRSLCLVLKCFISVFVASDQTLMFARHPRAGHRVPALNEPVVSFSVLSLSFERPVCIFFSSPI